MTVDENEFYREATQLITGTLEIETAMCRFLNYVKQFMPADKIYTHRFDPNRLMTQAYAEADVHAGRRLDRWVSWTDEVIALHQSGNIPDAYIIDQAEEHFFAVIEGTEYEGRKRSAIWIRLAVGEFRVGGFSLWAEGWNQYDQDHLRLLELIRHPFAIAVSNSRRYAELLAIKEKLADDYRFLQKELRPADAGEIIGARSGLRKVTETVGRVAGHESPVLLMGETGAGKEVIAAAIHDNSSRKNGPFIKVNCGAIPDTLIDSELFGHEKGAFTGAIKRYRGRFERAEGGTIFLDEIGELPLQAQVRFLRVLQEKQVKPVGGGDSIPVDARVIAATNRDLSAMVKEGGFREDLYFRINVIPIRIPPLRERREDIPPLLEHIIKAKSEQMGLPRIPAPAPGEVERLMAYHWPGNVRELQNVVEQALILSDGEHLSFHVNHPLLAGHSVVEADAGDDWNPLDQVVRKHIIRTLELTRGRIGGEYGAAKVLGMNQSTLRHKMKKLGIPFGRPADAIYARVRP